MTPEMQEKLRNWFTYHAPAEGQPERYAQIRQAAEHFAQVVVDCTAESADQTAALRKIREAVMTANASIACGGK